MPQCAHGYAESTHDGIRAAERRAVVARSRGVAGDVGVVGYKMAGKFWRASGQRGYSSEYSAVHQQLADNRS